MDHLQSTTYKNACFSQRVETENKPNQVTQPTVSQALKHLRNTLVILGVWLQNTVWLWSNCLGLYLLNERETQIWCFAVVLCVSLYMRFLISCMVLLRHSGRFFSYLLTLALNKLCTPVTLDRSCCHVAVCSWSSCQYDWTCFAVEVCVCLTRELKLKSRFKVQNFWELKKKEYIAHLK